MKQTQEQPVRSLGIDIGSTTVKLALMEGGDVLYERYERHYSQARQKILEMLSDLEPLVADGLLRAAISGSAGIGLAEAARLPFQQEVFVVGELVRALEAAKDALQLELQRQPTAEELAERTGAPLEDVLEALEMRGALSPVSLDTLPAEDDESAPLSAFLGQEEAGYAEFEKNDMLRRAMDALDERQQKIIRMRFFEGKGQREVAQAIGVSQMTVSRVERQALSRLREALMEGEKQA